MRFLTPIITGLALLCLELFLREALVLDHWAPEFFTLLIIWLGMSSTLVSGPIQALILGLIADVFAGSALGFRMLHAVLLFYAAALSARRVRFQGFFGNMLLGLFGGLISLLIAVGVGRLAPGGGYIAMRFQDLLVPRLTFSLIFAPFFFPIFAFLDRLTERKNDSDVI